MSLSNFKQKRKHIIELDDMAFGKVPPQSKDLETAVLGAIMLEAAAFDIVVDILKPESFYVDAHQKVFAAMVALVNKKMHIDLFTVIEQLKISEHLDLCGGPYYISTLTNAVVSSANIETHARIVAQKYMLRRVIQVGGSLVNAAYNDDIDVFDLIDEAEREVGRINEHTRSTYTKLDSGVVEVLKKVEELRHSNVELTGITTGFKAMDLLTCGWQSPDFIVLAARPSVGKTALALNMALAAARAGHGVGFFSLEMSRAQLIQRLLSMESEIPLEHIIRGRLSDDGMRDLIKLGQKPLMPHNFYIDDTSGLNIYEFRSKARKMKKDGVQIIFLDYLQLMGGIQNGRADNREQEIAKISRDIKGLCKELAMPIIALSQLSRGVETRDKSNKMPVLSDLRESGAIEQDADIVAFIYRPEYYGQTADQNGNKLNGDTEIKFAKHRSGALDIIKLKASLAIQKFYDGEVEHKQLTLGQVHNHNSLAGPPNKLAQTGISPDDEAPF